MNQIMEAEAEVGAKVADAARSLSAFETLFYILRTSRGNFIKKKRKHGLKNKWRRFFLRDFFLSASFFSASFFYASF